MRNAELRNHAAVKVSNREDILAWVPRDFPSRIALPQSFALAIEAFPHDCGEKHSDWQGVLFFEIQDRDHPVDWVCEAIVRGPVTNQAGLVDIAGWRNDNGHNAAIGGGELIPIDISEIERAFLPNCQLGIDRQRAEKRAEREKEL